MQIAVLTGLAVFAICALTWFYGRVLYPIQTKPISAFDEPPEVERRIDQRFRQFEGE